MRVVVDCANGAAYKVAPTVLQELGAEVIAIANTPNGTNINDACGAQHPAALARKVREYRADVGIALDGDADRCILVDELGHVVDGDQVLGLCALELHASGSLRRGTVVATVMSNLGLERALAARGVRMVRADVGDRYVSEAMRREQLNLGGEQSGHMVFLDHNTTGDGLLTALQVLALQCRRGRPLSELLRVFEPLPQVLRSVRVREKPAFDSLPKLKEVMARVESELGSAGRVLVRYSGTEPVVRVMLQGDDQTRIQDLALEICGVLQRAIGEIGT
jgi:phosphoglucosamine mutase